MAIDPNIKKKADDIRNKIYGKEVRESLASGLEEMSSDVVENEGRQSVVEGRQDSVESQWQAVSAEMTDKDVISAPEIIAARGGEANLKARLDKEHQDVTAQLPQKVGGGRLASMSDMGQDIKEAMTGGSVAVVGVDSVTEDNIVKGQVTPITTNFLKLTEDSNLFDGVFVEGKSLAGANPLTLTNGDSKIGIVPIQPNTSYSVVKEDTLPDSDGYHRFRIATTSHTMSQLKNSNDNVLMDGKSFTKGDGTDYLSVLSGPNDRSLLFMLSRDHDPYVEVTEGIKTKLLGLGYEQKFEFKDNIKTGLNLPKSKDKILWFGDSLSQLKQLPHLVGDITESEVIDISFAGASLTTHHTFYNDQSVLSITNQILANDFSPLNTALDEAEAAGQDVSAKRINQGNLLNVDTTTLDKSVVFAGTNDFGGARHPLAEFEQNARLVVENLIQINPKMQIYFITPSYRGDWDNPNTEGHILTDYIQAIIDICEEYNTPVKNLFLTGGINSINATTFLNSDLLHQNDTGDKLLADKISKFITTN